MGVFQNNLMGAAAAAASAGGGDFYSHQIANSLRFPGTTGSSLTNSNLSAGNRKTFTFSVWVKKNWLNKTTNDRGWIYGYGTGGATYTFWGFGGHSSTAAHQDDFKFEETSSSTKSAFSIDDGSSERKFRDPNAWMHVVLAIDTTQSTAGNRQKVWINGEAQTLTVTFQMAQDYEFSFINNGEAAYAKMSWLDGLEDTQLAELHFLDGVAADADDFGETKNGVWIPKAYSGSYGTEGYYLKFESSSDLGNDSSGNNNDFTVNNLSAHDQLTDTPTFNSDSNGGNFATMNPLSNGSNPVLAEGNLMMDSFSGSDISGSLANFALPPSSGKWYFECFINSPNSGDNYPFIGLTATTYSQSATMGVSQRDLSINLGTGGSEKNETYVGSITTDFTSVSAYADNTVCGVFVDMDARKLWYAKDGAFTNSGNPQNGTNPNYAWTNNVPLLPHFVSFSSYGADSVLNFGQDGTFAGNVTAGGNSDVTGYGNFKYDPGDYKALCAGNLPVADAVDPAQTDDDYPQKLFTALAYSGDGGGSFTTGFQPDLVWVKRRNGSQGNGLWDSSRGTTKVLNSDSTSAEATSSGLTSFNSTGYTMGNFYNQSGNTYASWSWRANGGTTSSETAGSINTTVQVNQNAGFSIVQYVGDGGSSNCTMAHGLGAKPAMVFLKDRDTNGNNNQWQAWHHKLDTNGYFYLSSNDQQYTSSNGTVNVSANTTNLIGWQRTSTTGGSQTISESGDNFLMYIWAEIEGFSKFGSYKGNGNADGTFVYTGFRPALVTTKRTDGSGGWLVHDDARNTGNPANLIVQWNDSGAEFSGANDKIDMLSNGFKVRSSNAGINGSGNDYVYAAWAHNPFKYATAR